MDSATDQEEPKMKQGSGQKSGPQGGEKFGNAANQLLQQAS